VRGDDRHENSASLAKALADGVAWLVRAVETKHWTECSPIGFYFAKLWYYEWLYPMIFTVSALGAAALHAARTPLPRRMSQQTAPPELTHPHPVSLTR
jgi:squalene-hopene/tetraprenyl-beta-curcumene cyclase